MIYLATPYSDYPGGWEAAFNDAVIAATKLQSAGLSIFSPVVHFYPISIRMEPKSHEYWVEQCMQFLSHAQSMIVMQMRGWGASKGIFEEVAYCQKVGKRYTYLGWPIPEELPENVKHLADIKNLRLL